MGNGISSNADQEQDAFNSKFITLSYVFAGLYLNPKQKKVKIGVIQLADIQNFFKL